MSASTRKPGDALTGIGIALIALGIIAFFVVLSMDGEASPVIAIGWAGIGLILLLIGRSQRRRHRPSDR